MSFFYRLLSRLLRTEIAANWFALQTDQDILRLVKQITKPRLAQHLVADQYRLLGQMRDSFHMHYYSYTPSAMQAKIYSLFAAVSQVVNVKGEIVEAGVGYGKSLASLAYASQYFQTGKQIYGFDSFAGFPEATVEDLGQRVTDLKNVGGWTETSQALIRSIFTRDEQLGSTLSFIQNEPERLHLIKGFFEETMPEYLPQSISLLHIDCDLYNGYKHVLNCCWPRMAPGGLILFDEYDDQSWPGARLAVDDFCQEQQITIQFQPTLQRYTIIVPARPQQVSEPLIL